MGALQVQPFAGRISSNKNQTPRVVRESRLDLTARHPVDTPVDRRHCIVLTKDRANSGEQIVKRVPMLSKDDHLPGQASRGIANLGFIEELREFEPLDVSARVADISRELGELRDLGDLGPQL